MAVELPWRHRGLDHVLPDGPTRGRGDWVRASHSLNPTALPLPLLRLTVARLKFDHHGAIEEGKEEQLR